MKSQNNPEKTRRIDPALIPCKKLASGDEIPCIGLGTFGSDHVPDERIAEIVMQAADMGYRHFDCAAIYGNENLIGGSFQKIIKGGIPQEELWVTSKLWNDSHGRGRVIPACKKSLHDLRLDYLDLYLVHWPFPNHHPPGCDVEERAPDARPYIHEEYMETWAEMEKLVEKGLVRNIGTSNMTVPKLELLLGDANIRPVCNEMELHPHFQQPELFEYVRESGIAPIGFCPIGSPQRPERDRMPDDTAPIKDPVIRDMAKNRGMHPATICVKWAVQRGQIPIPFSSNPKHCFANLEAVTNSPLTAREMKAIEGVDRGCRLIKGHVFLWEGARSWKDLWDTDGYVADKRCEEKK